MNLKFWKTDNPKEMTKVAFEYNPKRPLQKQDMVLLDALLAKFKEDPDIIVDRVELIKQDGTRDSYDKWKGKEEDK